jgi:hypothetical protein
MMPLRSRLMAMPALLAGVVVAVALQRPGDRASAFSDTGSAVYAARVLTPSPPGREPLPALHKLSMSPRPAQTHQLPLHADRFDVRGRPSISAALINQVLAAYGSPMAGDGPALYSLGVKYGIDPAFCLAFFVHESAAGTKGEAVLTHNLGNIRSTPGAPSLNGYRLYDSWLDGAEDWYRLISSLYVAGWRLTTVDQIVPVYAPAADNNDPTAYIDDVEQLVSAWRAQS